MRGSIILMTVRSETANPGARANQRHRFIVMFLIIAGLYACGQLHRSAGAVLSPVLNRDLGLDARELAAVMAGLFLAAGVTQIPFGILLDRFGPRRCVTALVVVGIFGMCLFSLAESWPALMAGRIFIGSGFSGVFMSSIVLFAAWMPPERLTTWSGRITAVGGCGGLLATTPLAAAIDWFGWRGTIAGLAVVTAILVVIAFRSLRDHPPEAAVSREPKENLSQSFAGFLRVLRERSVWPMILVSLVMYTPMQMTLGLWGGPYLLEVHGLDSIERGNVLFVVMACHLVGALAFGPLERFFNTRKWLVVFGACLQSLQFLALGLLGPSSLAGSIVLMIAIAIVAPLYLVVTVHCQAFFPRGLTGRAVSMVISFSVFGVFITQTGSSFLVRALANPDMIGSLEAYRAVFVAMAGVFVLVALVYLVSRDIPVRPRAST